MYLLGIDAGSTITKAVLFDERGGEVGHASQRVPHSVPAPHRVERDPDELWAATCAVIGGVLRSSGVDPRDVGAVAVTSHGDGVYLVDADGRPTRPGILSLDTRAAARVADWERRGLSDRMLPLAGQKPWPGSPISVLAWLLEHEPGVMDATAHALPCKDMIKLRLTGVVSTDPTESSLSFTNVRTQHYDPATLELFGLEAIERLLPEVTPSGAVAGTITARAAAECGLREGTPVASGAHDVDCGAIGMGTIEPGQLAIIAGTFSINEVVSDRVAIDERWNARNFVTPGRWMNMSISPSSAANLEWFTQKLAPHETAGGLGFVEHEIAAIAEQPSELVYAPFLFGSPYPEDASAAFVGLRGWHERGHLLRAVMEGVVFNHRWHVDALREGFDVGDMRLTGGAVNSPRWSQLFADALDHPVAVSAVREASALGSAMLAGIAAGAYADLREAVDAAEPGLTVLEPTPDGVSRAEAGYERYRRIVDALRPVWAEGDGTSEATS